MKHLYITLQWKEACHTPSISMSHALTKSHGGLQRTSRDMAFSEALTRTTRAVFPLGKDQTLALYKNLSDESQVK